MTKATETALTLFALSALYFALSTGVIVSPKLFHDEILPYLPWWGLVTFGSYALFTLGWGIITFKDKKDKYEELKLQIDEAKAFYSSKGISLD
ncbi:hypothetical protein PVL30_003923 [Lodderomyces elongisporus]|uniref:Dolichol-phosphate mannosyltransferase subunit 3 n=1 Tax=Lodderomyces elongisporus (strain ATCC 11503 / CBS 2605 / JCM 1781 / NBRC 1676 / NRRL YB-4239) TaxID=379508 RepID=A5E3L1_LODEL|nr:uncharacterized protein PVL30_003923 [Lodderomyces elongisporus]EDK46019.1 conserved hypothetical protein [Lodderomyces elongisporus NRRL YB-4239]WLF80148.1 hypothetical protein PVL30_003923 [Lodderomyces elongisporus]